MNFTRRPQIIIPLVLALAVLACSLPGSIAPGGGDAQPPGINTPNADTPETAPETGIEPPQEAPVVPVGPTQQVFLPNVSSGGESPTTQSYPAPEEVIDPYVSIEIDRTSFAVGETFSVTGWPVQIGLPYYYLIVRDDGVQESLPLAQVTYEGAFTGAEGSSQVVEVLDAQADMQHATFTLRAIGAGVTTVEISVSGEIHDDQGASWSGAASGAVVVQVTP